MKSVVIAIVLGLAVAIAGWTFYAQKMQEYAKEQGIITQDKMYDEKDKARLQKKYDAKQADEARRAKRQRL